MSRKPIRKKQAPPEEQNQIEELVIRNKIEALTKQRDQFVTQANQQIAHLNGAIQALEQLLPENQPEEPEAGPKEKAPAGETPPTDA